MGNESEASSSSSDESLSFEATTTREMRINVDQEIEDENSEQPEDNPDNPIPSIFKVPKPIREVDPKAYDPVVASVGPFHHCPYCWSSVMQEDSKMQTKSQLDGEAYKPVAASCGHFDSTSAMQKYKWRCVWHLLSLRGNDQERANQLLEESLVKLMEKNDEVRSCYSEELPPWMDDRKLASIMLLDGCFIICLMINRMTPLERTQCTIETKEGNVVFNIKEKDKQLGPGLSIVNKVIYDLLKVENQIPFFIIRLLFDQLKLREDVLVDLALNFFQYIHPNESKSFRDKEKKYSSPRRYHHLLHLFYSSRIHLPKERKEEATTSQGTPTTSKSKWIPSAMELQKAGVKFRTNKQPSDSFLNITFNRTKNKCMPLLTGRRMEIPPLQIFDSTGPLFHNLIAFEQCYPNTEMHITTYTIFLECIIHQAEDVRLLHSEGILEHVFGNDQALADLFRQLGRENIFLWEKNYLISQINEINKFYGFKWNKLLAVLRRDYFSNPWTTISVLAAIFLLLLTIEQAIFSTLSYFHSS